MKKTKVIIPALGLLVLSTAASITGTVAWFSMNTTVNIAGMTVKTTVGNNLSIASDTTAGTAKLADSNFADNYYASIDALIEPVSTINGLNFFYTVNAKASGDASKEEYLAYNSADTSAFNTAYGTSGAVGYVDYAFQLKAVNASANDNYLNLTELNLVYNGTDEFNGINAFRVAIFWEKFVSSSFHAIDSGDVAVNKVLMKNSAAANFTATKAVAYVSDAAAKTALEDEDETALQPVTYGPFNYLTVSAGETSYYKVVVRLWLEGEDTTCNNGTFASLNDMWGLNIQWDLVEDANKANKTNITNTAPIQIVAANYTVTETGAKSYSEQSYNVVTGLTYDGEQVYTTQDAGTLSNEAHLFVLTLDGEGTPTAATSVDSHFQLL